jgi:hypothetical protein
VAGYSQRIPHFACSILRPKYPPARCNELAPGGTTFQPEAFPHPLAGIAPGAKEEKIMLGDGIRRNLATTPDGHLRHARFMGLREGQDPWNVARET